MKKFFSTQMTQIIKINADFRYNFSVALCVFSVVLCERKNYTELHRGCTECHRE